MSLYEELVKDGAFRDLLPFSLFVMSYIEEELK